LKLGCCFWWGVQLATVFIWRQVTVGPPRPTLGSVFSSAHRLWLNEDALGEYKKLSSVPGYLGSDRRTFNSHKTFLDHPVSHLRSYSFR
jgi:hypothetical protein